MLQFPIAKHTKLFMLAYRIVKRFLKTSVAIGYQSLLLSTTAYLMIHVQRKHSLVPWPNMPENILGIIGYKRINNYVGI